MGTAANITIKNGDTAICLRRHYDADLAIGGADLYEKILETAQADPIGKISATALAYNLLATGDYVELGNNGEFIQYTIELEGCKVKHIFYSREKTKGWRPDGTPIMETDSREWENLIAFYAALDVERDHCNRRIRKLNQEHGEQYAELPKLPEPPHSTLRIPQTSF